MEEICRWTMTLLKPEDNPLTRSIKKGVISDGLMEQFCKLIGQRYDDHQCSCCSGRHNIIPEVTLQQKQTKKLEQQERHDKKNKQRSNNGRDKRQDIKL